MKKVFDLKSVPIDEAEITVLDFETTGTSSRFNRVIEIGMVRIKNLEITDTFKSLINPECEIPPFITQLTGLTSADVQSAPTFYDLHEQIEEFIGDSVFAAHNLNFDHSFLKDEYLRLDKKMIANPSFCTVRLARKLYPELRSKSLGSLVKHFRIKHRDVHRALGDSLATAKILLKMIDRAKKEFHVETVEDLINLQSMPTSRPSFRIIKKKIAADFSKLTESPGIYQFKDAKDNIIYIGKAKSLKSRVSNYFSSSASKKAKKIVRQSSRLSFVETNSELTALLLEAELVKEHNPPLNSQLKRYSQHYFIKMNNNHSFPLPKVTAQFDFDGNDYFGPFNSGDTARSLVDITNKTFMLRECTEKDFKKGKICYLYDIKRCLAPCAESVQVDYDNEIDNVYEFLSGKNQYAVERLLNKMKTLSERQKYEEAAIVRDTVNQILNQLNRSSILAEPVNKAHALIRVRGKGTDDYILLVEGKVVIRNFPLEEQDLFYDAVEDYFSGTRNMFQTLTEKDLERLKICLSWMVKNRHSIQIKYLSQIDDAGLLYDLVDQRSSITE